MNGDNEKIFLHAPDPERGHGTGYFVGAAIVGLSLVAGFFVAKHFNVLGLDTKSETQVAVRATDVQDETAGTLDESAADANGAHAVQNDGSQNARNPLAESEYGTVAVKPPRPPPDFDRDEPSPVAETEKSPAVAPEKVKETQRKKIVAAAPVQEDRAVKEPAKAVIVKGTAANFAREVDHSKGVVLVDFWAPWCGPCRKVSPIVDEMATDFKGKLKVVKINVDDAPALSNRFNVHSIPCLLVFKDGKLVEQKVGGQTKEALKTWLGKYAK